MKYGACRAASKYTFVPGQVACHKERVSVSDVHHLVDDRKIQCADHEIVADPFNAVHPWVFPFPFVESIMVDTAIGIWSNYPDFPSGCHGFFLEVPAGT